MKVSSGPWCNGLLNVESSASLLKVSCVHIPHVLFVLCWYLLYCCHSWCSVIPICQDHMFSFYLLVIIATEMLRNMVLTWFHFSEAVYWGPVFSGVRAGVVCDSWPALTHLQYIQMNHSLAKLVLQHVLSSHMMNNDKSESCNTDEDFWRTS